MNNILKYFGIAFIALTVIGSIGLFYSYKESQKYQDEVMALIPGILESTSEQDQYSALGQYESCPKKESNHVEITLTEPIEAKIDLECLFANGNADVGIKLNRVNEEWVITKMRVSSDVFATAFNKSN